MPSGSGWPASARRILGGYARFGYSAPMHSTDDHEALQRLIDTLFEERPHIPRLEFIVRAELTDIDGDVLDVVTLLPPGTYSRDRLCDQLNSAITAHGWGRSLGTVQ